MKKLILVTDSLFVFKEHEDILQQNGFEVERLDKPKATEQELCTAIKGKYGYILGGIEKVTSKVIASADKLEAIAFTGSGYAEFIPAYEDATRKGIAISAAIGANAQSVVDYTFALIYTMVRNIPSVTSKGGLDFFKSRELSNLTLGVIGMGKIGRIVATTGLALGMRVVVNIRTNASSKKDKDFENVALEDLLKTSDIVSLHVNKNHGVGVLGASQLALMRPGTILINTAFPDAVESQGLHNLLIKKKIKAAYDAPPLEDFSDIPLEYFVASNTQTGFNTVEANHRTSDRVTSSIINLLKNGDDSDLVNPGYLKFKHFITRMPR